MKTECTILIVTLLLTACAEFNKSGRQLAGMGVITDQKSSFDNVREISMTPAPVSLESGGLLDTCCSIGLLWKNNAPDQAVITVTRPGIQRIETVTLRIGDKMLPLEPLDVTTDFDPAHGYGSESSKRFRISLAELREMQTTRHALVRISDQRSYVVGDLKKDDGGMFATFFADWLSQIPR